MNERRISRGGEMNFPWLFCLYVLCANRSPVCDAQPVATNEHQQHQQRINDQQPQENEEETVGKQEVAGMEETVISDTGEPPGVLDVGQADLPARGVSEELVAEVTDENAKGDVEIIPSIQAPPVIEEIPVSESPGVRLRHEGEREPPPMTDGGEEDSPSGGKGEEGADTPGENSDESLPPENTEKQGAGDPPPSHGDETQIEPPSLASATDPDPSGGGIPVAAEQVQIPVEGDPKDSGNVTTEERVAVGKERERGEDPPPTVGIVDEPEVVKPPPDDEGEAILMSYNEWKEKQLEKEIEEQEKLSGSQNADIPPSSKQRQFGDQDSKNYASSDCGAKIISSNKEAQKANHILNFNRDEYMINPCSANIWFIVELCEPIQIKLLEMANLELFSSVPESFAVYTSDRYPAREWRSLGTRFATLQRNLQSFQFHEHLFTKFVKIELLTFFGQEHYCPLTVLRIFGTSMEEEIDAEEIGEAVLPPSPTPLADDINQNKENGILDHAKDAVVSFVKNAAKVFTGEDKGSAECQGEGCPEVDLEQVDPTPAMDCWEGELTTSAPDVHPVEDYNLCASPCDDLESAEFTGICAAALCEQPDYWRIFPNCCLLVLAHTTIHLCCGISHCCFIPSPPQGTKREGVEEGSSPEGSMEAGMSEGGEITPNLTISPLETIPSANRLIVSNLSKNKANGLLTPSPVIPTIVQTPPTALPSSTPMDPSPTAKVVGTPAPTEKAATPAQVEKMESEQRIHGEVKTISPTPSWKEEEDLVAPAKSPPPEIDHTNKKTAIPDVIPSDSAAAFPEPSNTPQGMEQDPVVVGGGVIQEGLVAKVDSPPPPPLKGASKGAVAGQEQADVASKGEDGGAVVVGGQEPASEAPAVVATNTLQGATDGEDKAVKKGDGASDEEVAKVGVKGESEGLKGATEPVKGREATGSQQPGRVTEPATQGNTAPPALGNGGGAGHVGYGSQKDTLFMRLNNRIKSLELNLSLSSKYLEELSKSYKKQMEEMQKSFNKTVSSLTETVQKSQQKHQSNSGDITRIDSEVQELCSRVSALSTKTEDILQEVIERHLFLMVCEVLFFCALFVVCIRRERNQLRLARAMYERHLETPQRRNTLSHSNPSQHSPRGTAPEKVGLRSSGSLDDLLIIGPTTPLREAIRVNTGHQHSKPAKSKHKATASGVMTNGSLPDMVGHSPSQLPKGPKRKTDYRPGTKHSHSTGDLKNGSSASDIEWSKPETNGHGRHSPENIGAVNGSHGAKVKRSHNGGKVKR